MVSRLKACFIAGTPIEGEFGSKGIEEYKDFETYGDGCDRVWARDEWDADGEVRSRSSSVRVTTGAVGTGMAAVLPKE